MRRRTVPVSCAAKTGRPLDSGKNAATSACSTSLTANTTRGPNACKTTWPCGCPLTGSTWISLASSRIDSGRCGKSQQAELHDVPMRSRLDLRPVRRLARLIRAERYAIVHTHSPRTALVGGLAAALARVPLVHHAHSPTSNDSTRRWRNRRQRRYRKDFSSAGVSPSHCRFGSDCRVRCRQGI